MLLTLAFAATAALQDPVSSRLQVASAGDSAAARRRAERAQADFERARRHSAPVSSSGGGRCDVRIGRLCYWYDDAEPAGPPEPERTTQARERLLARLDSLGALAGGDPWILGQRVRYLVEHGRGGEAAATAGECAGDAWWCDALEGFAHHASGDVAAAEAAFDRALATMPEAERCRWNDLSLLLDGDVRKRYERMPCAARAAFERRYWALSRPLWLRDGNDRRAEHLARATMSRLQREARSAMQMSWGDDVHELLVRYGWPVRWSREAPSASGLGDVRMIGHDDTPSFSFAPSERALAAPGQSGEDDWIVRDQQARSRYAPAWARGWSTLPHQLAMFRRGDSAAVVAAWDLASDTLFRRDSLLAAVALLRAATDSTSGWSDSSAVMVTRRPGARRTDVVVASAPWEPLLVSLEAWDSTARAAARARYAHRPPEATDDAGIALSDLLLLAPGGAPPATLDEAATRALGRPRAGASQGVDVYWEVYGAAESPRDYTLTVVRAGAGWMRRTAEAIGVVTRQAPVHMRWTDPPPRPSEGSPIAGMTARALHVDLAALPPGRYVVTLTVLGTGNAQVSAIREIEVR